jgi:hypothetical protein
MSIISNITQRTSNADFVGIWDKNWQQIFLDARPISVNVTEPSKNMEHPLENGSVMTDHRVILPVEIDLAVILSPATYNNMYDQLKKAYKDATLFTIYTKTSGYENMMIVDMPHSEDAAMWDTITIALKFKECILVEATFEPLPAQTPSAAATPEPPPVEEKSALFDLLG